MPGKFITLEGTEGAGKTTSLPFIQQCLTGAGKQVLVTREPGGTPVAEAIRDLLLHGRQMLPKTELLLMFAARYEHVETVIRPALAQGQWVICDRFTDASFAYQGGGRGLGAESVSQLAQWVHPDLNPDLCLLFDIDPQVGMARAKSRGGDDRFEREKLAFFQRARQAYLQRSREAGYPFAVLDAAAGQPQVRDQIQNALNRVLF